jgi:hypothetical protein
MKAEELRIGNYLLHDGYFIKSYSVDGFINVIKNIDNYEPIPLTEEWLLKFGFEKRSKEKEFFIEHFYILGYTVVNRSQWKKDMSLEGFGITECDNYIPADIKYVHQLQNLYYALTQKELNYER